MADLVIEAEYVRVGCEEKSNLTGCVGARAAIATTVAPVALSPARADLNLETNTF